MCTVQNKCVQLESLQSSFENATIGKELYNELDKVSECFHCAETLLRFVRIVPSRTSITAAFSPPAVWMSATDAPCA